MDELRTFNDFQECWGQDSHTSNTPTVDLQDTHIFQEPEAVEQGSENVVGSCPVNGKQGDRILPTPNVEGNIHPCFKSFGSEENVVQAQYLLVILD